MEEVYEELRKRLNWKERIVLRLFKRIFLKVYNITRVEIINNLL